MTEPAVRRSTLTVLLAAAAFVIVIAGMRSAQAILVPFLLAAFIAIISAPPMLWLEEHGLPRWLAICFVAVTMAAAAIGLSALVGPDLRALTADLPGYRGRIDDHFVSMVSWLQVRGVDISEADVIALLDPARALELAADVFNGFGGLLKNALLIGLTVLFMLFEASSFPAKLRAITDDAERSQARFGAFTDNLRRYLAIKTLTSLATGAAAGLLLWLVGVDYPVLWAMLAFGLNYVPTIGSIIAAVPAVLLALVQLGPFAAAWTALGYFAINMVVGSVLEPRFMGQGLGLSPLVVFASLVFWGWVLGPIGMFLSVPLTMTAKIALDSNAGSRWLAVLLGPEPRDT